ncbi:unnamed protein product [Phyllotreta striolata]|uniref:Conserved oligomeric Golgi complex subunit 2 n=1 Tax=Phyllotreta striolata TaxID=444603 RepID=A0A9N9THN0_PHYSR|nr:unnamed protein product [Phyllotreta striolata]
MPLIDDSEWKQSFFKENFSVDNSLSKYTQKSDLETLRRDLKNYGAELQQQMTEILRNETEAIVNLAEYLTNLSSKIEHLSLPFFQLREEIMALHKLINTTEASYKLMLNNLKDNNTNHNNLNLKLGVIACSLYIDKMLKSSADSFEDLIILDRIVGKYSFQKNYMDELNIVSSDLRDIMVNVENNLLEIVNRKFLEAIKNSNEEVVTRCLRLYDNLKKQKEAQETYRIRIVKPYFQKLLTEKSLERYNQDLEKLYNEVSYFIDVEMKILLDVLEKNADLKSYNFVLHSLWREFDKQSREGLPLITAPGNPELFQKRFKSTWKILSVIAEKSHNKSLLKDDSTFQDHIKRFNLPVYFEIRYQKIASDFETAIFVDNNEFYATKNDISCNLKLTLALWVAISQCFHPDVYLDQLADQFIKLSMLLLSRYLRWFESIVKSNFSTNSSKEKFIMDLLVDLNIVEKFMCPVTSTPVDTHSTIYKILDNSIVSLVPSISKINKQSIEAVQSTLKANLVKMKVDEMCNHLQHVGAIPRLYRRTNRSTPKEPSTYMIEAIKPVTNFLELFHNVIHDKSTEILNEVILQVTEQYLKLVQGVLRSVCKTEESLRRLKSRNVASSEDSSHHSDTGSDEMKIREQIKLDVAYFLQKLYPLGSEASRNTMDQLKKEI